MRWRIAALMVLAAVGLQAADTLRVLSFNVRYPNPNDGANYWEKRTDVVTAMLKHVDADLIGTQELFQSQGDFIVEALPEYEWFGMSRRGNHEDEHMGIFYRPAKLEVLDQGEFWLSETPDVPGSQSWDMSLPRNVSWAKLRVRASGRQFFLFNTHFAHRGQDAEARVRSARVILDRLPKIAGDAPVLLTGDFNAMAGAYVHHVLTAELQDAWLTAEARSGPAGTSSRWVGRMSERRIDWILYKGPWRPVYAETVTYNHGGRYPTDHYPVLAEFELEER